MLFICLRWLAWVCLLKFFTHFLFLSLFLSLNLHPSLCNRRFSSVRKFIYAITCETRYFTVWPISKCPSINKYQIRKNFGPAKQLIIKITNHCSKLSVHTNGAADFKMHKAQPENELKRKVNERKKILHTAKGYLSVNRT